MIKRFFFRIELTGTGETIEEAWADAQERFTQVPGDPPTPESDLEDRPILGTEYSIDGGPCDDNGDPVEVE